MKNIIYFFMCVLLLAACSPPPPAHIVSKTFTPAQARQDLENLKLFIMDAHPNPNQFYSKAAFDSASTEIANAIDTDLTEIELYNRFMPLIDMVKCAHTELNLPEELGDTLNKIGGYFPIPLVHIDSCFYVNSLDYDIPLGAKLLRINDEPVDDIIKSLLKYEHPDGNNNLYKFNQVAFNFTYDYARLYGTPYKFLVVYTADTGKTVESKTVDGVSFEDYATGLADGSYHYFSNEVGYDLELEDETSTAVLKMRSFGYDSYATDHAYENFLTNSFRLLNKENIQNLVLDLRENSGGTYRSTFTLLSYLTRRKTWPEFESAYTAYKEIPYANYLEPAFLKENYYSLQTEIDSSFVNCKKSGWSKELKEKTYWEQNKNAFKGKLYIITDGYTMSSASVLAAMLKDEKRGVLVGEETGAGGMENNSFHTLKYQLPNTGLLLEIPMVHAIYYLENKTGMAGNRGVIPDYNITLTMADLLENNDTQMSFIKDELITQQKK